MKSTVLNLEEEKKRMRQYAAQTLKNRDMVNQINQGYLEYWSCRKMMGCSIVISILTIVCTILRTSYFDEMLNGQSWIVVSVVGVAAGFLCLIRCNNRLPENKPYTSAACLGSVTMFAVAVCMGPLYLPVPYILVFLMWVNTIVRFYRHKIRIWEIVNGTEGKNLNEG